MRQRDGWCLDAQCWVGVLARPPQGAFLNPLPDSFIVVVSPLSCRPVQWYVGGTCRGHRDEADGRECCGRHCQARESQFRRRIPHLASGTTQPRHRHARPPLYSCAGRSEPFDPPCGSCHIFPGRPANRHVPSHAIRGPLPWAWCFHRLWSRPLKTRNPKARWRYGAIGSLPTSTRYAPPSPAIPSMPRMQAELTRAPSLARRRVSAGLPALWIQVTRGPTCTSARRGCALCRRQAAPPPGPGARGWQMPAKRLHRDSHGHGCGVVHHGPLLYCRDGNPPPPCSRGSTCDGRTELGVSRTQCTHTQ